MSIDEQISVFRDVAEQALQCVKNNCDDCPLYCHKNCVALLMNNANFSINSLCNLLEKAVADIAHDCLSCANADSCEGGCPVSRECFSTIHKDGDAHYWRWRGEIE